MAGFVYVQAIAESDQTQCFQTAKPATTLSHSMHVLRYVGFQRIVRSSHVTIEIFFLALQICIAKIWHRSSQNSIC